MARKNQEALIQGLTSAAEAAKLAAAVASEAVKTNNSTNIEITKLGINLANISEKLNQMAIDMKGFTTKTETEEVKRDFGLTIKRIEDGMAQHNADDKESFGLLTMQNENLRKTIWMAMGAVSVIAFFIPIILKFIFKV